MTPQRPQSAGARARVPGGGARARRSTQGKLRKITVPRGASRDQLEDVLRSLIEAMQAADLMER